MTPEVAKTILQLLQRVDIKGNEAQAFMVCQNALIEIAKEEHKNPIKEEEPKKKNS